VGYGREPLRYGIPHGLLCPRRRQSQPDILIEMSGKG
jgi:hypothetical protein